MLFEWAARKAGLTDDDMLNMTYVQVDAWIELHQWTSYVPDHEEEEEREAAQRGMNAFFHT